MKLKFIMVGGIAVPIAVDDDTSITAARKEEELVFEAVEGREEVRERKLKLVRRDDK